MISLLQNNIMASNMNGNSYKFRTNGHQESGLHRRYNLPVIYVTGTYYDTGYDVGRTFRSLINTAVDSSKVLQEEYLPRFNTIEGKEIYDETLLAVQKTYPQYIRELEGIADGAEIPFYKLFLLHLDDIILQDKGKSTNEGQGCSTVMLNEENQVIIGHNEDAFKEMLNNVYVAHVRITEVEPNEVFTAFCYAGQIPGYAMGFNHYLAFSINILGAKYLSSGKIPRTFATRALLTATSMDEVEKILRFNGGGVADALSVNLALLKKDSAPDLYNIEAAPSFPPTNESAYNAAMIELGHSMFHCNKFLHLNIPEDEGPLVESSDSRHTTRSKLPDPKNKQDVITIIGDNSQKHYNIYRDLKYEKVATLASAIFDFIAKTWSIYIDNPKTHEPLAVFPLYDLP